MKPDPAMKKLKFRCMYLENGCDTQVGYTMVLSHSKICKFITVECPAFSDCRSKTIKKNLKLHTNVCPYISLKCEFCKKEALRKDMDAHYSMCKEVGKCGECDGFVKKGVLEKKGHSCLKALTASIKNLRV